MKVVLKICSQCFVIHLGQSEVKPKLAIIYEQHSVATFDTTVDKLNVHFSHRK